MGSDISCVIIETVVKNKLRDIKDSPERSIRNLVDMALHFSDGRFQRAFFQAAQRMLQNENSAYYKVIQDLVFSTEEQRLMTFGMNLGYNSCTLGARTIRETEQREHFNIPWSISLEIDSTTFTERAEYYHSVITQGEQLGVYSWLLFAPDTPQALLPLVSGHPERAFAIFCSPDQITRQLLDEIMDVYHVMLVVRFDDNAGPACHLLRESGFLYSVYVPYSGINAEEIANGDLFRAAETLHPLFTMLLPEPFCTSKIQQEIYKRIVDARNSQTYQTIPWDIVHDSCYIDSIISNDACAGGFDQKGRLYTPEKRFLRKQFNLFHTPLPDILKSAFPKEAQA